MKKYLVKNYRNMNILRKRMINLNKKVYTIGRIK